MVLLSFVVGLGATPSHFFEVARKPHVLGWPPKERRVVFAQSSVPIKRGCLCYWVLECATPQERYVDHYGRTIFSCISHRILRPPPATRDCIAIWRRPRATKPLRIPLGQLWSSSTANHCSVFQKTLFN